MTYLAREFNPYAVPPKVLKQKFTDVEKFLVMRVSDTTPDIQNDVIPKQSLKLPEIGGLCREFYNPQHLIGAVKFEWQDDELYGIISKAHAEKVAGMYPCIHGQVMGAEWRTVKARGQMNRVRYITNLNVIGVFFTKEPNVDLAIPKVKDAATNQGSGRKSVKIIRRTKPVEEDTRGVRGASRSDKPVHRGTFVRRKRD